MGWQYVHESTRIGVSSSLQWVCAKLSHSTESLLPARWPWNNVSLWEALTTLMTCAVVKQSSYEMAQWSSDEVKGFELKCAHIMCLATLGLSSVLAIMSTSSPPPLPLLFPPPPPPPPTLSSVHHVHYGHWVVSKVWQCCRIKYTWEFGWSGSPFLSVNHSFRSVSITPPDPWLIRSHLL